LRKMRQGQRFKARLNKRPSGQIHCSQLLQQNRPGRDIYLALRVMRSESVSRAVALLCLSGCVKPPRVHKS
ncbi:hypothetical protein, partial [Bradyrhizobium sp. 166]|uniref:hypothetical protein n=1 Tax=Bradyrhizobium sp. 166 TaxID=2782638 RepID=UPI001FFBB6E1